MNLYISDLHFGHKNVIIYDRRPFADVDEMDHVLIELWNARVCNDDHVYIVGDLCYKNDHPEQWYLRQLKGRKYLVIGNHDWRRIVNQHKWRFELMTQQINMKIGKRHIILNHYPMLAFSGAWRGVDASYQLFGHVHTSPYTDEGLDQVRMKMLFTSQYDVGVDNNDFTPVSWKEVDQIINNQMMSLGMCRNEL